MGKQLAKLYDKSPSLWARVIKHKYNPPARIWELQPRQHVSQQWLKEDISSNEDWSGRLVMEPQLNSSKMFGSAPLHLIYGLIYWFWMILIRMSRSSSLLQGSGIRGGSLRQWVLLQHKSLLDYPCLMAKRMTEWSFLALTWLVTQWIRPTSFSLQLGPLKTHSTGNGCGDYPAHNGLEQGVGRSLKVVFQWEHSCTLRHGGYNVMPTL